MFDEEHQERGLRWLASWLHVIVCSLGRWSTTKRQNNIFKDVSAARCLKSEPNIVNPDRIDKSVSVLPFHKKKKTKSNKNIVDVQLPALNINVYGSFQCSSVMKSMHLVYWEMIYCMWCIYTFYSMHHDLFSGVAFPSWLKNSGGHSRFPPPPPPHNPPFSNMHHRLMFYLSCYISSPSRSSPKEQK